MSFPNNFIMKYLNVIRLTYVTLVQAHIQSTFLDKMPTPLRHLPVTTFYLWVFFLLLQGILSFRDTTSSPPINCCWCCSVAKSCPTLCNPMDYSMPGFPVLHSLPGFAQTHVHWFSDGILPFLPLSLLLLLCSIFPRIRVF